MRIGGTEPLEFRFRKTVLARKKDNDDKPIK